MKREFLKELKLEDEVINKIMDENGADITREQKNLEELKRKLEEYSTQINDYESKVAELNIKLESGQALENELKTLKEQITQRAEQDKQIEFEKNINNRFSSAKGESKFLNEYTEKGVLNEFIKAIKDESNIGKSDVEIYNNIVSEKQGLFQNLNPPVDIAGVNSKVNINKVSDELVDKIMGTSKQ